MSLKKVLEAACVAYAAYAASAAWAAYVAYVVYVASGVVTFSEAKHEIASP